MHKILRMRGLAVFVLLIASSLACKSVSSIIPAIPTFPPEPGTSNVPTGSSPMSGDWNADTDFGHIAFTVDPDGNKVVTTLIKISSFTCGGTYLSTKTQILNSWTITDEVFSGTYNLDDSHFLTMTIDGKYEQEKKTFIGTWQEDSHGTLCSGEWEAIPRK